MLHRSFSNEEEANGYSGMVFAFGGGESIDDLHEHINSKLRRLQSLKLKLFDEPNRARWRPRARPSRPSGRRSSSSTTTTKASAKPWLGFCRAHRHRTVILHEQPDKGQTVIETVSRSTRLVALRTAVTVVLLAGFTVGLVPIGGASGTAVSSITEYPVPTVNANPFGIAAGPDGNLWFTEPGAGKVAKITTDGTITEYPIPMVYSVPRGIAAGPDGNLWFTEENAGKVASITTDGTITEYAIPTAYANPWDIAAGPDGNLWFTEVSGNKVAKLTVSGTFTEYAIPTANSFPYGIVSGPDGNLWFTERAGNVAKISPIPTPAPPPPTAPPLVIKPNFTG